MQRVRSALLVATVAVAVVSVLANAAVYPAAVKASGHDSEFPPPNATDSDPGTRWACNVSVAPCWLRLDLGTEKSLNKVTIQWHDGDSRRYDFAVAVAGPDFFYRTVVRGWSAGTTSSPENYWFTATPGRFIKITVFGDTTSSGVASILEASASGPTTPAPTPTPSSDAGQVDEFGITKKYATASDAHVWTAAHWANGQPRNISGVDPADPTGFSENRGDQAELFVDGDGILEFRGSSSSSEPRLHLNDAFQNVEITFYYRKEQDHDVDWGGMVVGARSGAEGHSQSSQYCDAHTYYGRFRNDGKYDFEKELKHPASSARSGTNIWNGVTDLPAGQWIGMKYVVQNVIVNGARAAKLELYRDTTHGAGGGTWTKIGETTDTGGWAPPQSGTACASYSPDDVPLVGGGTIVLRNSGVIKSSYKWMSVREISAPAS